MNKKELAGMIDHTILKADATQEMIERLCDEAIEHGFASVCVNPYWVSFCAEKLDGTGVMVCTVIGFPLGATSTISKVIEAEAAVEHGAEELDMVINVGALKDEDLELVEADIRAVVEASGGKPVKVIIEICYLDDRLIKMACHLSEKAGASFVKTSTGFGTGGATIEAIKLMREAVGDRLGVKASGGIRDYETAVKMIEAGANRIGASAGVQMVMGAPE